ncbi:MAG: phosphomannomutase/phosphoglucomutase [Phycisphaeraceae bacterium]|nr:phosphomannomutase/phosphoglucomutase [Phycisphaeraceae bacterium]
MIGKVFKAYDVRAIYPRPLNEKIAWQVGHAAARYLLDSAAEAGRLDPMGRTIVVGRDMRSSSVSLRDALVEGLRDAGARVVDVGLVDTPMVYFAINHLDAAGGIQVTASHNAAKYNGFKISGRDARPIGTGTGLEEIKRLAAMADRQRIQPAGGGLEDRDLWSAYRDFLLERLAPAVRDGERRLKVVVDAAGGMAGVLFPKVFEGVAGLEIIPLDFEVSGDFTHEPNPLIESNLDALRAAVVERKADFGVYFDGDADRCRLVDDQGAAAGCDHLFAWMADTRLRARKGGAYIFDLRSSRVVPETIAKRGGTPVECRVGHVFMKAALREHEAVLGGELSGHFYFEDHFGTDSGARTFVEICNLVAGGTTPVSDRMAAFTKYATTGEVNFKVESTGEALECVHAEFSDAESSRLDGVSYDLGDAWFNVRPSNTEPLLRLIVEGTDAAARDAAFARIKGLLGKPVG